MHFEKSKIDICLDSFSEQIYIIWVILTYISLLDDCLILPIYSIFLWLYRVTDEAFIAET